MSSDKGNRTSNPEYRLEDILSEYKEQGSPDGVSPPAEEPAPSPEEIPSPTEETYAPPPGKVLTFPTPSHSLEGKLEEHLDRLKQKAEDFADQMFSQEGMEVSEHTMRLERLIPGVDEEQTPPPTKKKSPPRERASLPPDVSPAVLSRACEKGLGFARLRFILVCALSLFQLYLLLASEFFLPLPPVIAPLSIQTILSCLLFLAAVLLTPDAWIMGLPDLFRGRPKWEALLTLSLLAVGWDALLLLIGGSGENRLPFTGVSTVALACAMGGVYRRTRATRLACRTAAACQTPYAITLDEDKWNGDSSYAKHPATAAGFGSQIRGEDGCQRIFRVASPILLITCLTLSLLASVGMGRSHAFPWCLAALTTAAAGFSVPFVYTRPFFRLTRRLAKVGAALAGWPGAASWGRNILITDTDLFPPGSVSVSGIKVFGDLSVERVTGVTASMLRRAGSGLDLVFSDLLRSQRGSWVRCDDLIPSAGGGLSARVNGRQVLVGTGDFMTLMEVPRPEGINVKNAVFCAIDGELAGLFVLQYHLHDAASPTLSTLLHNRTTPVLAVRDFNLYPAMLRQRFKLPADRMEYPSVERRFALSDPEQPHSETLVALLCREGLLPYGEAVTAARRLRRATLLSTLLACLGAATGLLLTFYLAVLSATASLTAFHLLLFLSFWTLPVWIISDWADRF